jgi:hypothetical protein
MKRKIRTMALSVIGALICASSAQADVVFEFENGSTIDGGVIGTLYSATNGVEVRTMETVEIIGQDGTKASEGATHKTNVNASWGSVMGIASQNDIYDTGENEYGNFNAGEAWTLKFDADVELVEMDWGSMGSVNGNPDQVTISSTAFPDIVYTAGDASGDTIDLGNVVVLAGTEITIADSSVLESGHTYRLYNFTVAAVPEPATLGLMAIAMGGLFVARRFRI